MVDNDQVSIPGLRPIGEDNGTSVLSKAGLALRAGGVARGLHRVAHPAGCAPTDNELSLAGGPNDSFLGLLSLWLAGLGIRHVFICPSCPTDQPQIARNHRTLDNWAVNPADTQDLAHLQASLDREHQVYYTRFPYQAVDCTGRPPVEAHPELLELLRARRPYRPEDELHLFNLQYVHAYLTSFQFQLKVLASGQVNLGRRLYPLWSYKK